MGKYFNPEENKISMTWVRFAIIVSCIIGSTVIATTKVDALFATLKSQDGRIHSLEEWRASVELSSDVKNYRVKR